MNRQISIFGHKFSLTWNDLCIAVILVALGTVLIVYPNAINEYILIGIGALSMIYGALQVIQYFRAAGAERMKNDSFVSGLFCLITGLEVILTREKISALLFYLFGIMLIVLAAYYVQGMMNIRYMKSDKWKLCLFAVIVSLSCGIVMLTAPNLQTTVVGAMLTAHGILFLIFRIQYLRICREWSKSSDLSEL